MLKLKPDNYRDILTQEREKQGLSQNKLSEIMGKSNTQVCKFESGAIQNPGANFIIEIANALGYDVCLIKKNNIENKSKTRKPARMILPLDDPDFLG